MTRPRLGRGLFGRPQVAFFRGVIFRLPTAFTPFFCMFHGSAKPNVIARRERRTEARVNASSDSQAVLPTTCTVAELMNVLSCAAITKGAFGSQNAARHTRTTSCLPEI